MDEEDIEPQNYARPYNADFQFSNSANVVGSVYKIIYDQPLPEHTNIFTTAYRVENLENPQEKNLYALIFTTNLSVNIDLILYLQNNLVPNIISPITTEITYITPNNKYQITSIMREPAGISLHEYIKKNHPLSINFIVEQIITPLNRFINNFTLADFAHGNINHNNIYITPDGELLIKECISTPNGYLQLYSYETMERSECNPLAKGESDLKVDYFALGVVIIYSILGYLPSHSLSEEELIRERSLYGSYNAIFASKDNVNAIFKNLLKGLLNDKKTERFGNIEVMDWIEGKSFTIAASSEVDAARAIIFNNKRFVTGRSISYELHHNWDIGKKFIKEDELAKWVERGLGNVDNSEKILFILSSLNNKASQASIIREDYVTRILAILDPSGPIRTKFGSMCFEAVGAVLLFGYVTNNKHLLESAIKTIVAGLWTSIDKPGVTVRKSHAKHSLAFLLDRAKLAIERRSYGFSIERAIYELNPRIACLSNNLQGEYITDPKDLIKYLERKATSLESQVMDRHIAGFLAHRLELTKEMTISKLSKFPTLSSHKEVVSLMILSIAQIDLSLGKLPHISNLFAHRIGILFEGQIHNRKTLELVNKKLKELGAIGELKTLIRFISDPKCIMTDQLGFMKAQNNLFKLRKELETYQNTKNIYDRGYRLGLKISVIISYIICSIAVTILVYQAMVV